MANNNGSLDAYVRDFFNVARLVTREESDAAIGPLSQALWKETRYSPACAREFLQTAKACTTFAELLAAFKDFLVALERRMAIEAIVQRTGVQWQYAQRAYDANPTANSDALDAAALQFANRASEDDFDYRGDGGLGGGPR